MAENPERGAQEFESAFWCRSCGYVERAASTSVEIPAGTKFSAIEQASGVSCSNCGSTNLWGGALDPDNPPWRPRS